MQKLLRICAPPSSPPLCCLVLSSSSLSPPPKQLAFSSKPPKPSLMATTTTTTTYSFSTSFTPPCPTVSPTNTTTTVTAFPHLASRTSAAVVAEPRRPWSSLKIPPRGSWLNWLLNATGTAETVVEGGDTAVQGGDTAVEESESEGDETGSGSGEKTDRVTRRRTTAGGSGGGVVLGNPDLLSIPGVGPRNLRKLVDKGIGGVADLKQLYRDKFFGKSSQNMVQYLQSSVGIIHRNHAESITTFIKESVDEEVKEDGPSSGIKPQKNRITLCVEGNISVGKTTFLRRIAGETLELRDLVEIVPEPVDKWQDIGADHFNILDAFYAEPKRYAYTFQNYVFVTRVMQERDSSGGIEPLRLMERSVFSDRMVFVRAVHEAKWMSEMEINIYDSWFDPVVSCLPGLIPDGFIYLRASPDTCHKRMMLRKRAEEGGVSLDYLRDLHEKHESWFSPSESGNLGSLSVSKPPFHMDSSLHPDIRDRVYFLEGPQMHSSLQKVPALILDCDPDIDFNRDVEAKSHYARQVAEFFEFVKKGKDVQPHKPSDGAGKDGRPQIILPQNTGLWVPDGKHFPDKALQSLDLRRAMSAAI